MFHLMFLKEKENIIWFFSCGRGGFLLWQCVRNADYMPEKNRFPFSFSPARLQKDETSTDIDSCYDFTLVSIRWDFIVWSHSLTHVSFIYCKSSYLFLYGDGYIQFLHQALFDGAYRAYFHCVINICCGSIDLVHKMRCNNPNKVPVLISLSRTGRASYTERSKQITSK